MSDYFDQFGRSFERAAVRRAHLGWYARLSSRMRTHGLATVVAALVVATPAAAVGALSGWFSAGKPDVFYPASAKVGLGRTIPGTRMLPIRVADPGGGPPWGMRLVQTNRGDTCVQVGRVEYGELGSLGIDYSWGDDHKFHAINPNEGQDDICGSTDAAGHGFLSSSMHGWAASAFMPGDYGSGSAASYCQRPAPATALRVHACPAGSLRLIFVGLLGPDAKSVTYRTPSGTSRSEGTVGGVGAYLIVFRQTASDCAEYSLTPLGGHLGCKGLGFTEYPMLRAPNAVTSVTYADGKTCSDQPSRVLVAAWRQFNARMRRETGLTAAQARAQLARFAAVHHAGKGAGGGDPALDIFEALTPQCPLAGWVADKQPKVTQREVASPVRFTAVKARHYCSDGSQGYLDYAKPDLIGCDDGVPRGYQRWRWASPDQVLVTASFIARRSVTSTNSWYEWQIMNPGNGGGGGNRTQTDIRAGERVFLTIWVPASRFRGVFCGTVSFMANAGRAGPGGGDDPGYDGSVIVGRFSFRLH